MSAEHWGQKTGQSLFRYKTGLVIGGLVGLVFGGFFGLIFGAGIGLFIERALRKIKSIAPQQLFFRATFTVMGRIAKADGCVTESEIDFARSVMTQMRLNESARSLAIRYFTEGKNPETDLETVLKPLAIVLKNRFTVKLMFLELQLQAAMVDGEISPAELKVIEILCHHLVFTPVEMRAVVERIKAAQAFAMHSSDWDHATDQSRRNLLSEAYGVLGVNEAASDAEVKKAWRKLMSQHHPDKLVSKGLPEEMLQLAKEKTQEIQSAYDKIRKARESG